jgi:hypothetical protein
VRPDEAFRVGWILAWMEPRHLSVIASSLSVYQNINERSFEVTNMKANALPAFANDIKIPIMDNEKDSEMLIRAPPKRARPLAMGFLAVALCYLFLSHFRPIFKGLNCHMKTTQTTWYPVVPTKELVPFEAHIMSKCPDARDCLREMVLPTMQRVYDKVNFTLSFIGR